MRFLLAALAITLVASVSPAQITTHVRVDDLASGPQTAAEFESMGFDVVEGGIRLRSVELVVSDATMEYLNENGYAVTVIAVGRPFYEIQHERMAGLPEGVPAGYEDLATINQHMLDLQNAFPTLARRINVTQVFGGPQTFEGRDIYALRISDNVTTNEDEPSFLLVSNHHCRELITPVIATEAMDKLLQDYGTDPDITAVVDANEIWIAPTWNPDGLEYVWNVNANWRKNRAVNGSCTGVDINRNYGAGWSSSCGGSTSCSDTYRGPSQASEAETQTMVAFTTAERFAKVVDFHSSGRETLWELASGCSSHPWASYWQAAAIELSQSVWGTNSNPHPSANGEQYEWQNKVGAWAFLLETGTSFQPAYSAALSEAALCFGAVMTMLEEEIKITGHTTDACSGAALDTTITFVGLSFPYQYGFSSGGPFGRYDIIPPDGDYTLEFSATGYATQSIPVTIASGSPVTLDVAMVPASSGSVAYCTAGTSASGCQATLSSVGTASASAASGFTVNAATVEGGAFGQYYFGSNGQQGTPWGNGSSFRCVVPPTSRAGVSSAGGTGGLCDGAFSQDLNALWTAKPAKNPGAGATVQLQFWYRDPQNTSNQTTSFSDALEFGVCP